MSRFQVLASKPKTKKVETQSTTKSTSWADISEAEAQVKTQEAQPTSKGPLNAAQLEILNKRRAERKVEREERRKRKELAEKCQVTGCCNKRNNKYWYCKECYTMFNRCAIPNCERKRDGNWLYCSECYQTVHGSCLRCDAPTSLAGNHEDPHEFHQYCSDCRV